MPDLNNESQWGLVNVDSPMILNKIVTQVIFGIKGSYNNQGTLNNDFKMNLARSLYSSRLAI